MPQLNPIGFFNITSAFEIAWSDLKNAMNMRMICIFFAVVCDFSSFNITLQGFLELLAGANVRLLLVIYEKPLFIKSNVFAKCAPSGFRTVSVTKINLIF